MNMTLLRHVDIAVFSIPTALCATTAGGFRALETVTKNPVLKAVGWLGSRSFIALTMAAGAPLLVYVTAKTALLKGLDAATRHRVASIHNYKEETSKILKASMIIIPAMPLVVVGIPALIKTARSVQELVKMANGMLSQIQQQVEAIKLPQPSPTPVEHA